MRALSLWNRDFWEPLGRLDDVKREVERSFNANLPGLDPSCDIVENKAEYRVVLDLPGIKKDEVKIEVVEDRLTISGERKFQSAKDDDTRHWVGRGYGRFERSFSLPPSADAEKIQAKFEEGVLTVVIPKAEATQPRQIRVS